MFLPLSFPLCLISFYWFISLSHSSVSVFLKFVLSLFNCLCYFLTFYNLLSICLTMSLPNFFDLHFFFSVKTYFIFLSLCLTFSFCLMASFSSLCFSLTTPLLISLSELCKQSPSDSNSALCCVWHEPSSFFFFFFNSCLKVPLPIGGGTVAGCGSVRTVVDSGWGGGGGGGGQRRRGWGKRCGSTG